MPYASDKLYNGYLRKNMALIVRDVKVREILPLLPCLTLTDREEIEAKREVSGNYNAMQLLLANLRRRDCWPEQLIAALEELEATSIAREMQEEYNTIQGLHTHVPATHPSLPIAGRAPPEAAAAPAPPPAPVEPRTPSASEAALPHSPQVSPDVSPRCTPLPPSPSPPGEEGRPTSSAQEPVENSETSLEEEAHPVHPDTIPLAPPAVSQPGSSLSQTSSTFLEDTASQHAPLTRAEPAGAPVVTEGPRPPPAEASAWTTVNPEPVQDTSPPTATGVPAMQVSVIRQYTEPACQRSQNQLTVEATASINSVDEPNAVPSGLDDLLLSKPGVLLSVQPNTVNPETSQQAPENVMPLEIPMPLYSGNSQRLEISTASVLVSAPLENGMSCEEEEEEEEQPEENQMESCLSSLPDPEVLVHSGHVSGEPSIQNQDANHGSESETASGQNCPSLVKPEEPLSAGPVAYQGDCDEGAGDVRFRYQDPPGFIHNGHATLDREKGSSTSACAVAPPSASACAVAPPSAASQPLLSPPMPSESLGEESKPLHTQCEEKEEARAPSSVKKYILTAAGVGVFALFVAWRMKN